MDWILASALMASMILYLAARKALVKNSTEYTNLSMALFPPWFPGIPQQNAGLTYSV
jgi:hypothetical protein